ncbi:MAG: aminoglycoside phosphotransferase family protein [Burkholderiales bacterium]|nr:aminoglycoside phosphotransferase family protein [Burkholderiales bacterium]
MTDSPATDAWIGALARAGLLAPGERATVTPLAGGVSSDIVRVEVPGRTFCVKRALAKLRVAADWRAPVERNHAEAEWMRVAGAVEPDAVPGVLAEDLAQGLFAMPWLDPRDHPVWKAQLRDGRIDAPFAAEVGRRIARIHAATAGRADIAARFATDHIFHPIRLEAYLVATAARHADLAGELGALVERTRRTKLALVHGDVSPKNILAGPRGPVFLDAECAWYGDPAFDLAFCLNHLLLKCVWRPQWLGRYLDAFAALAAAYLALVAWEPAADLEARAARLLPGLLLARVDGKSPVEYITAEPERDRVRGVARALLARPVARLGEVAAAWRAG